MQSRRFVLVGTRVDRTEVVALAQAAVAAGLDVRAAAQRPPERRAPTVPWHRVPALASQPGWGGVVASWVSRAVRGLPASFTEQLLADPWLADEVADADGEVLLVALDDPAAQALARWRSETGAVGADGRPVPVLTWDQAAEELAQEIAQQMPQRKPAVGRSRPPEDHGRPLGAKHRVTVIAGGEGGPRAQVRAALTRRRVAVTLVDPDEVPDPDLSQVDAVLLDGLGPAVLLLDRWPHLRVAHLQRSTDRRSPWRHLVPAGRVDHVLAPAVGERLSRGDADAADEVLTAALDAPTVELMRAASHTRDAEDAGDEQALELAARMVDELDERSSPAVLRELHFLVRATGSLSLERALLERQLTLPGQPEPALRAALDRVRERWQETEPGWLPELPPTPVEPAAPDRVLHLLKATLPQRQAGYTLRAHQSLVALTAAGLDVVGVAAPEADTAVEPDDPVSGVEETLLDGVRYLVPAPVADGPPTAYLERQARAVLDVVRQERPALLHVHSGGRGYDLGIVGAAVARATGLPWVYEVRGLFESLWTGHEARAERGETFARRMAKEAELVGAADAAVTLAQTMRADLIARGVEPDQVTVVPNAVDPEQLAPTARDDQLAARWGTRGAFTLGYVSNLDHRREQVEDLIRAAVILRDLGLSVRALVVGDGPRRAQLEETSRRLGADDLVTFTGRVPHSAVAQAYALIDVLVVPRSSERAARLVTPLKPYEAMAMGVPVVVSEQPALLEVIGDGERGWSYPAGNAPALARLVQRLAADPAHRAAVAARARDWVTRERTWTGNAQRYAELYRSVLDGRSESTG